MTSEMIGYIAEDAEIVEVRFEGDDELFYLIPTAFRGLDMNVMISSYIYDGTKGTVRITGGYCTTKDYDSDGKVVHSPYIFAKDLVACEDQDTPLTNEVQFKFRVTKVYKYLLTEQGLEVLFLYGTVMNVFNTLEVYKICLKGAHARKYKNCTKGTTFTAKAYIKPYRRGIEFIVHDIVTESNQEV